MATMSALALVVLATKSFFITFGTTSVASKPMITITTISSSSVNPRIRRMADSGVQP